MIKHGAYEIRRLTPSDVPAVLDVIRDVRSYYGMAARVRELLEPGDLALLATYQQERSAYFVALAGSVPVGGAGIAPLAGNEALTCELQRMYLRPEHHGQGLGKSLLYQCIQAAKSFDYRNCYAETVHELNGALGLYRANGFRDLTAPMGKTGHGHTDRWMLLDLGQVDGRPQQSGPPPIVS